MFKDILKKDTGWQIVKPHWGNVIVIWGYINKIALIWFEMGLFKEKTWIPVTRLITSESGAPDLC